MVYNDAGKNSIAKNIFRNIFFPELFFLRVFLPREIKKIRVIVDGFRFRFRLFRLRSVFFRFR